MKKPDLAIHDTAWEAIEQLACFDGEPQVFLQRLLELQCRLVHALGGCFVKNGQIISVYPPPEGQAPQWLKAAAELAEKVAQSGRAVTTPMTGGAMYGAEPDTFLILLPVRSSGQWRGVAAFLMPAAPPRVLLDVRQRLELGLTLLSGYELRLTCEQRTAEMSRVKRATKLLLAVNEHDRFLAAAMAVCNTAASQWNAQSVALGIVRGDSLRLVAMSHTDQPARKMQRVQAVEAAMDECRDQDIEVASPASPESTTISRAAAELVRQHGPCAVLSLPLRRAGAVCGVLTIETAPQQTLNLDDVQTLRLALELLTSRLMDLADSDRWWPVRLAAAARRAAARLVGPTHTGWKVAAIAVAAGLTAAALVPGTYRVESSFVIEAQQRQIISAPFDGYLVQAHVRPGDKVEANATVLAELDASEFRLQLAEAEAQEQTHLKEAEIARREDKIAEAHVAEAQAAQARARADLLRWRVKQAAVTSPLTGVVLTGDLARQLGAPVQQGQMLFETGPVDRMRVRIAVPEDDVVDLRVGQTGELAAVSHPDQRLAFTVERIEPVAEVSNEENVFMVYARLEAAPDWLRPGMEGVSRIDIDERSYLAIWTRDLIHWLQMKLWW